MADEPQAAPEGTSPQGQAPAPVEAGQPNDPAAFQADYTKKYQALSDEKKAVEAEKAAIAAEKARIDAERARIAQQQYVPPTQPQTDPLLEQFGDQGAAAIKQQFQTATQGVYQQLFAVEYARQEDIGRQKYGSDAWTKHDYIDPATGQKANRIMDLRIKGIPLDQAWNAVNPIDRSAVEQEVRDKVYAEIKEKGQATPASGTAPAPSSSGTGHAKTTREAFDMAVSQLSR